MLYPCIFLEINSAFGPLEVDLFASRVTYQTCHFISRRPDPPWGFHSRDFQPPMVSYWQGLETSMPAERSAGTGSISLEWSDLVSSSVGDSVGIIPANCPNTRSHSETIRFPDGDGATTRCVVCPGNVPQVVSFQMRLLNSYCSPGDLHQPVLWLLLWKWACWCSERGHNPVSGSVSVIANLLTE